MIRMLKLLGLMALAATTFLAHGSGIRVAPLRLVIDDTTRTASLTVSNLGATATAVEVELVSWRQDASGSDVYEPSQDLFFAPPIVRVPARGETTLRFRAKSLPARGEQSTYRVYVRELPAQGGTAKGAQISLRFGIPVFLYNGPRPAPKLNWAARRSGDQLDIELSNSGDAHLRVNAVHAYPADADIDAIRGTEPLATARYNDAGAGYLMPGTTHAWALPTENLPDRAWVLIATDDNSGQAAEGVRGNGHLWLRLDALQRGSGD